MSFLSDRDRNVKLDDQRLFIEAINHSIVQESGIGPTLCVICIRLAPNFGGQPHVYVRR